MPKLPAGVSFWGAVTVVMAALHLKDRFGDYQKVNGDPESGRIALDEDEITLLDTEIPRRSRAQREKNRHCCACCSPKCGLFWKAFGIVLGLVLVWQMIKLAIWAVSPTPSGLEGLPAFKSSLACANAPFVYTDTMVSYSVPMGSDKLDHATYIRGSAVGSVIFARGADDATEVKYDLMIRANKSIDLQDIVITAPTLDPESSDYFNSRFTLSTPYLAEEDACMNYEVTVYLPPQLKQLSIETHTLAHIQFDQSAQLELDELVVTMFSSDENNLFLPNTGIRGKTTTYEAYNGWVVGEVALLTDVSVNTHRGAAVTKLRVIPEASSDALVASLHTVGGFGRTDITYVNNPRNPHRTISSTHHSSQNGDLYLDYQGADFSGQVDLTDARSWTASGLRGGENLGDVRWVGDKNNADRMSVNSKGWAKLQF